MLPTAVLQWCSSFKGVGSLLARFQLSEGPSKPSPLVVQFTSEGSTLSGCDIELVGAGYRFSLIKKRFAAGKGVALVPLAKMLLLALLKSELGVISCHILPADSYPYIPLESKPVFECSTNELAIQAGWLCLLRLALFLILGSAIVPTWLIYISKSVG